MVGGSKRFYHYHFYLVAGALTVRSPAFHVPSVSVPAPSGTCGWGKQAFLPLPFLSGCWSSDSSLACFSRSISFCSHTVRCLWLGEASVFTITISSWLLELCQLQFTCHQTPVGGWREGRGGRVSTVTRSFKSLACSG